MLVNKKADFVSIEFSNVNFKFPFGSTNAKFIISEFSFVSSWALFDIFLWVPVRESLVLIFLFFFCFSFFLELEFLLKFVWLKGYYGNLKFTMVVCWPSFTGPIWWHLSNSCCWLNPRLQLRTIFTFSVIWSSFSSYLECMPSTRIQARHWY